MIPISKKLVYTPFSVIIYYIPSGVKYSGGAKKQRVDRADQLAAVKDFRLSVCDFKNIS
jgi:hypothetical protein